MGLEVRGIFRGYRLESINDKRPIHSNPIGSKKFKGKVKFKFSWERENVKSTFTVRVNLPKILGGDFVECDFKPSVHVYTIIKKSFAEANKKYSFLPNLIPEIT